MKQTRHFLSLSVALGILALALIAIVSMGLINRSIIGLNRYGDVISIEARSDYRAPDLVRAAWHLPVARTYARSHFEFQGNQSFCGPTSVANLLHSIGIPMSQQESINGTRYEPWFGVLIGGMTIDELADLLAIRTHRKVDVVRDLTLTDFRALMATANDPARRMIVNFHRGPLFGRGSGHFSPILGYLKEKDLVFVGDVNAKYRPFLTPVKRLWQATDTIDGVTGKERGVIIVGTGQIVQGSSGI